jgi:hypothetical protein
MNTARFPMVYRHGDRPELTGRLCRVVLYGERQFWLSGAAKMGTMGESCAVEFEDGTKAEVMRNAVVRARSRLGRKHVRRR